MTIFAPAGPVPTPVEVPPPAAQWQAARGDAVLCEVAALAFLRFAGADATAFLQGQLSNDVRALEPGAWQRSTYNSPKGRVLANLVLWKEHDAYGAVLSADLADPIRKRLAMYVLRSKVIISDATSSHERWGFAGPAAADALREALGGAPEPNGVLQHGSLRVLGLSAGRFLMLVPADDAAGLRARLVPPATAADHRIWDWLAIRAGEPLVTQVTQDQFVLQAANLDVLGAVSFDKGCYTGQEIVARTHYLGRLKERLFAFHAAQPVSPGTKLYSPMFGDQACGTVVNTAPAPQGGSDLLAVVQTSAMDRGELRANAVDGARIEALPLPYTLPEPAGRARPTL